MKNKILNEDMPIRRTVYLNDRAMNQNDHKIFNNEIKTYKYTWWNFFPKALIFQFMRAANLYFLISTVISCISIISPIEPFSAIFPLFLVLSVSLTREAIEDYRRHRNDDLVNEQKTFIFNNKNFTSIMWKDLQIGDIIKINCEQILPADILLIATNEENGIGFIETANLDGERNLKCKTVHETVNKYGRELPLIKFKGKLVCDLPNNQIHNFKGLLYLEAHQEPIMLSNANIMLRGTSLKNTEWAVGMIIYSGQDTKIMKNQGQVKYKSTHIEKMMNPIIVVTLVIQTIFCAVIASLSAQFQRKSYPNYAYLYGFSDHEVYDDWIGGLLNYFTYFLLLNTLVPISLIISLEVAKMFQTSFIEYDEKMHYTTPDGFKQKMKVLNTLIHEELGKVDCIFTDKTGTLTSNTMVFRNANVMGQDYNFKELSEVIQKQSFQSMIQNQDQKDFYQFWLCLALCHDVIMEKKEGNISYQGSSPDEVCLVEAAQKLGVQFHKKTINQIFIEVETEMLTFKLLHKIDFTSDRKRMSIIVEDTQTNKIIIFTKGADSFLLKNLSTQSEVLKRKAKDSLKAYSKQGLRTLCLGKKEITKDYFLKWKSEYDKCSMGMVGIIDPQKGEKMLKDMEDQIENGFQLLGVTALEDKLQDGVPEVLADIKDAGINVWMLTGDKLETAENIGYLCNLLDNSTKVFRIQSSTPETTRDKLFRIKGKIGEFKTINEIQEINSNKQISNSKGDDFQAPYSTPSIKKKDFHTPAEGLALHDINDEYFPPSNRQSHKKGLNKDKRSSLQSHSGLKINKNVFPIKEQNQLLNKDENGSVARDSIKEDNSNKYTRFSLIIEGEVIAHALQDSQCSKEFLQIIPECSTIICCRSTPTQKAEVVKYVKKHFNKTCLAIGDGGNDVTMIQEADIGVGIIGKEGNQAALSSDYYFGQFRFLWRLLFVHGRWNLFRSSYFVNYFFLKNFVFTLQQFFFAFFCGYSGQTFWEDGYLLLFNSVVTACAPVYYAGFEQDVNPNDSPHIGSHLPTLYKIFRSLDLFSYKQFWKMITIGSFFSITIFFSNYFICYDGIISEDGKIDGLWYMSVLSYFCTVCLVWAILFMETTYFSLFTLFGYVIASILLFFPTFVFIWDFFAGPVQGMLVIYLGNWKFWLSLFLNVSFCCIIMYLKKLYIYLVKPQLVQQLQYYNSNLKKNGNSCPLNGNESENIKPFEQLNNCAIQLQEIIPQSFKNNDFDITDNNINIPPVIQYNEEENIKRDQTMLHLKHHNLFKQNDQLKELSNIFKNEENVVENQKNDSREIKQIPSPSNKNKKERKLDIQTYLSNSENEFRIEAHKADNQGEDFLQKDIDEGSNEINHSIHKPAIEIGKKISIYEDVSRKQDEFSKRPHGLADEVAENLEGIQIRQDVSRKGEEILKKSGKFQDQTQQQSIKKSCLFVGPSDSLGESAFREINKKEEQLQEANNARNHEKSY